MIAIDESTVVFVEVKTWDALNAGDLEYAIGSRKKSTIIRSARAFLNEHPELRERSVRFDVIFLQSNVRKLRHMRHAFTETR